MSPTATSSPKTAALTARRHLAQLRWSPDGALWWLEAKARRRAWTAAAANGVTPHQLFAGSGDRHWLWLNTMGRRAEPTLAPLVPGVPPDDLQVHYTGSSGDRTLVEGWRFYRLVKDVLRVQGRPLAPASRILDYGCGWGRITRFFIKEVDPSGIVGIDCDPTVLETARAGNRWCTFDLVDVMPPTGLPEESFDAVYAYSVFSHLSEEAHDRWLDEFHRVLKPGGVLIVTTRPRDFIELCAWLRSEEATSAPDSHRASARAFLDTGAALAAFDAGEYCYSHRGGDDPPHFGETCIPEGYVHTHWTDRFRVLEFIDDRRRCEQNVIVVQKAGT